MTVESTTATTDKFFVVDARTILQLGRQSIKDHTTALIELVKNAYDADARAVLIDISQRRNVIRIADNGVGMDEATFDKTWLRIGYSAKRRAKRSPSGVRRVVGEKGVGRISADRLGGSLELRTAAEDREPFSAKVSWNAFDVEGRELQSIPVHIRRGIRPRVPEQPSGSMGKRLRRPLGVGTELLIRQLRQEWTKDDIDVLVEELESLVSPFGDDADFQISLRTDIAGAFRGPIVSTLPDAAELELRARLFRNRITYEILDRRTGDTVTATSGFRSWVQLSNLASEARSSRRSPTRPRTGVVSLRLLYFPQHFFRERAGNMLKAAEVRDRTVGVRIYRDSVRVRPYGDTRDSDGDWLGLSARKAREPAGVSRGRYRIPPTELSGAVFLSRDGNRTLQDSAGREGLVHNEAFGDLRTLTLGCLRILETYRHQTYEAPESKVDAIPALMAVESFSNQLSTLRNEWLTIRETVKEAPIDAVELASAAIATSIESLRTTQNSIDTLVEQSRLFRGLSSLGIAASVFGHETQSSITQFLGNLNEARDELHDPKPNLEYVVRSINRSFEYAKRVGAWGAFAIARVRHEKRKLRTIRVDSVVEKLINELRLAYTATKTELVVEASPASIRCYPMDLEAIALNLLANAYTFAQDSKGARAVRVEVGIADRTDRAGVFLIVADSGPGVPKTDREIVWEPLYTTKRDATGNEIGTGLGLAIIDSIVQDMRGYRSVDADPQLKGARFEVWLPAGWRGR